MQLPSLGSVCWGLGEVESGAPRNDTSLWDKEGRVMQAYPLPESSGGVVGAVGFGSEPLNHSSE